MAILILVFYHFSTRVVSLSPEADQCCNSSTVILWKLFSITAWFSNRKKKNSPEKLAPKFTFFFLPSSNTEESCHHLSYAYFKEGILLLNLLEILLSEVPFTPTQQLVSPTISLHLLERLWKSLSSWHRPILASVYSTGTGHQLLSLPKSLDWCPGTQKSGSEILCMRWPAWQCQMSHQCYHRTLFPLFSFPWWKAGVTWKTSAVASCCWPEVCYWTGHYPVASAAWFIPIYSAKPLSGSVYSPLLPSDEEQFISCHLSARNLLACADYREMVKSHSNTFIMN